MARLTLPSFGSLGVSNGCPVCAPLARAALAFEIVEQVRMGAGFAVTGLVPFWTPYKNRLCLPCQAQLARIDGNRVKALKLLEEAVNLDRNNKPARENLEALRHASKGR